MSAFCPWQPFSASFTVPSLHCPLVSVHCYAISHPTSHPVWHFREPPWLVLPHYAVVFCLWEVSCAMLLRLGPAPFPIVCCHMEARTNMKISLSSCCSLTFSGTQLALNAEIIILPITQANSVSSLCAAGWRRGPLKCLGSYCGGRSQTKGHKGVGLMVPHRLYISLFISRPNIWSINLTNNPILYYVMSENNW